MSGSATGNRSKSPLSLTQRRAETLWLIDSQKLGGTLLGETALCNYCVDSLRKSRLGQGSSASGRRRHSCYLRSNCSSDCRLLSLACSYTCSSDSSNT